MQSSCLILSNLLNLPPIFFFNSLWFSIVFSNEISRTHVLLSLQRGYLQWRKFPRGDFPEQRLSIPSETRLVGRKLIRAGREKKREKRDGERPEATKLLYPTFILLFPASSPRAASISPGPFPFRDARENNLESTLVVAVKLHPKLQRQRHRKPIQRRTTARDIFPPFHASSSPPLCSALLALWIVWRWRVMAGPGARKPPRGPRIGRSSAVGDVREDESSCLPNSCSLSLSPSCILSALVVTPLASLLFLSPEEREILSTFLSLLLLDSSLIPWAEYLFLRRDLWSCAWFHKYLLFFRCMTM